MNCECRDTAPLRQCQNYTEQVIWKMTRQSRKTQTQKPQRERLQWLDLETGEYLQIWLGITVSSHDLSPIPLLKEAGADGKVRSRALSPEGLRRLTSDALDLLRKIDDISSAMSSNGLNPAQTIAPETADDEQSQRSDTQDRRSPTPGFTFGMRLGCVREDQEYTKSGMAKALGISPSTWASYENDKSFPSTGTIMLFCRLFGVREKWLMENEGPIYG